MRGHFLGGVLFLQHKKTFLPITEGTFSLFQQHSVIHKFTAAGFFKLLK